MASRSTSVDVDHRLDVIPSAEQLCVNEALRSGYHVLVNSCAGSGKTTTCCTLAAANPEVAFLLMTYNARLKVETKQRVKRLAIKNLEVHSFHAAGVLYFSDDCRVDEGLSEVVRSSMPPRRTLPAFDVIIIDEAQDVTPLFFGFVQHICRLVSLSRSQPFQIICIGDEKQAVYAFRGSDARFLTLAPFCMAVHADRPWVECCLSTSYRMTASIVEFIRGAMHGGRSRIRSAKPRKAPYDSPVLYYTGNPWEIAAQLAALIRLHTQIKKDWKPEDIMVLGKETFCCCTIHCNVFIVQHFCSPVHSHRRWWRSNRMHATSKIGRNSHMVRAYKNNERCPRFL